jgi:hypothetical protein
MGRLTEAFAYVNSEKLDVGAHILFTRIDIRSYDVKMARWKYRTWSADKWNELVEKEKARKTAPQGQARTRETPSAVCAMVGDSRAF